MTVIDDYQQGTVPRKLNGAKAPKVPKAGKGSKAPRRPAK